MATTSRSDIKREVSRKRTERRQIAADEQRSRSPRFERTILEFQPDAVEIEHRSVPGGIRWTLYTVFALLASAIAWACWAEVDQIVVCPGKLVNTAQPVLIQTASTAPIRTINAKFGEIVRAGDLLATLDPTFSDADVNQLQIKINALQAAIARLTAERDGQPFAEMSDHASDRDWVMQEQAYLERQKEYTAKLEELEAEFRKFNVQKSNTQIELDTMRENVLIMKQLKEKYDNLGSRGSATEIDMLSRQKSLLDAETQVATQEGKLQELDAEMETNRKRSAAYIAGWRSQAAGQLLESNAQYQAALQDLSKAMRSKELVEIRVPQDLPYHEFYVQEAADRSPGSVVQPAEPLFKLIPMGTPFEAEVDIPGKDIGRIRAGDFVRVKLTSFPYQKYGWLEGTVRTISEASFEKETTPGAPPISTYRARVELKQPLTLKNVSSDFRLMPGMVTDADIKVGKRRVIEYFLYPIIRSMQSSIREPN